jgi:hypothetical protein
MSTGLRLPGALPLAECRTLTLPLLWPFLSSQRRRSIEDQTTLLPHSLHGTPLRKPEARQASHGAGSFSFISQFLCGRRRCIGLRWPGEARREGRLRPPFSVIIFPRHRRNSHGRTTRRSLNGRRSLWKTGRPKIQHLVFGGCNCRCGGRFRADLFFPQVRQRYPSGRSQTRSRLRTSGRSISTLKLE